MVIAAARAGKHVLCEKPFTISLADADAMIAACRDHGVQLGMWMVMRYSATTRLARALLQAGAIGQIVNIRLADVHNKVKDYYQKGVGGRARATDWRPYRAKAGGGALIMNAIHQLDALRYMTGLEVTRVTGEWVSFTGLAEVEDMIDVLLRYSNGAIGSIDTANYAPGGGEPGMLRIYGSKGQIQLGRGGVVRVYVEEPFAGLQGDIPVPALTAGEWHEVPAGDRGNSRTLLLDDYVRAVMAGRTPAVTGEDGRAAIEIVLAAYQSAERGGSVTLPMPAGSAATAQSAAAREPALAGAR
jgi:predicted dehydrogenase